MTRITGLATGLDVDSIVQETMQAYQTKIDTVDQQKMVLELQQEMYREVIKDCRDFYDKYFNVGKSDSILLQRNWGTTTFESASSAVTVTSSGGAEAANYSVQVTSIAKSASYTMPLDKVTESFYVNNVKIEIDKDKSTSEKVTAINEALKNSGVTAKYSEFSKGIVFTTDKLGTDQSITISGAKTETKSGNFYEELENKFNNITSDDAKKNFEVEVAGNKVTLDLSEGFSKEKIEEAMKKNGIYISEGVNKEYSISYPGDSIQKVAGSNCQAVIYKDGEKYEVSGSNSNSITLDGVTFKFNSVTTEKVNITSKTDITKAKDNIVKFVSDYNTLMEKLNTLINEKRDSDYMPLTDAQKEEMTEKQIELWEKKVKVGQLSRDSDLTRIRNAMKTAMSSIVGSSGQSLKSFGITAVSDYSGTKNGTFSIDEDKLTKALENNPENVMKVFINNSDNVSEKGVLQQLKSIFDKETQNSTGSLIKKAGIEGSAAASNNTLSRRIAQYETKISRMESLFSSKQQALYTKYARLETLMNNLNSQSSSLTSMFSS